MTNWAFFPGLPDKHCFKSKLKQNSSEVKTYPPVNLCLTAWKRKMQIPFPERSSFIGGGGGLMTPETKITRGGEWGGGVLGV